MTATPITANAITGNAITGNAGIDLHAALSTDDGWLRALVRQLVDSHAADDAVQEAWVLALQRPPAEQRSLRAWLSIVARRMALRGRRAETRRRNRELEAGTARTAPSSADLAQRVEARQLVAKAVLELEEPYRAVVLQRFFQQRSPSSIAQLLGIPAATVRTRLHRGLQRLRVKLGENDTASLRRYVMACVTAPALTGSAKTKLLAAMALSKTWLVGGVAVATAAVLIIQPWAAPAPPNPVPGGNAASGNVAAVQASTDAPPDAVTRELAEQSSPEPVAPPKATTAAPEDTLIIAGRVATSTGLPIANAEIFAAPLPRDAGDQDATAWPHGARALGRSGTDGRFRVAAPDDKDVLTVGPPWVALRTWPMDSELREEALIVAVPAVSIAGVVVDENDNPLAGVSVKGFCERVSTFPSSLQDCVRPEFPCGQTDEVGAFRYSRIAAYATVELTFEKPGYGKALITPPETSRMDLRIVLPSQGSTAKTIVRGVVLDPRNRPVAGAKVGCGASLVTADQLGQFELPIVQRTEDPSEDQVLFALGDGYLPAVRRDLADILAARRPVELQLMAPELAIRGRVVDADGTPRGGMTVYLWDVVHLGDTRYVESGWAVGVDDEWIGPHGETDENGMFAIEGLPNRPYRLRLLQREPLFAMTTAPIQAGTVDVEITVDPGSTRTIRGRVQNHAGAAVASAAVQFRLGVRMRDGNGTFDVGERVLTAEDGAFELRFVPVSADHLVVEGEAIDSVHLPFDPLSPEPVLLTVARRCKLRVFCADDGARVRALDAKGNAVPMLQKLRHGHIHRTSWEIESGSTPVLSAREDVVIIEITPPGQAARRCPVALRTDLLNELRL